jgi:hypothetical protein
MKKGAYPKMKLKKEPGQPSINKTTEARKADPAGEPGKTPPPPPKAGIKEDHTKACRSLKKVADKTKGLLSLTAGLWFYGCLNDGNIIFI